MKAEKYYRKRFPKVKELQYMDSLVIELMDSFNNEEINQLKLDSSASTRLINANRVEQNRTSDAIEKEDQNRLITELILCVTGSNYVSNQRRIADAISIFTITRK